MNVRVGWCTHLSALCADSVNPLCPLCLPTTRRLLMQIPTCQFFSNVNYLRKGKLWRTKSLLVDFINNLEGDSIRRHVQPLCKGYAPASLPAHPSGCILCHHFFTPSPVHNQPAFAWFANFRRECNRKETPPGIIVIGFTRCETTPSLRLRTCKRSRKK